MAICVDDIVRVESSDEEVQSWLEMANQVAPHVKDRADLHARDYLERYINVAMGEIAEQMVLKWLQDNGKQAVSAVDKSAHVPDAGHDVILRSKSGGDVYCSVKSSLSVFKQEQDILSEFRLATKQSELRKVNIQVYFWLVLRTPANQARSLVPSTRNAAIIGWATKKQVEEKGFERYATEERETPKMRLHEMCPMATLLNYIL